MTRRSERSGTWSGRTSRSSQSRSSARDLWVVEQITGRLGYAQPILRGASGGAVTGLLIGWVFGWFDWISPLIASALLGRDGLIFA